MAPRHPVRMGRRRSLGWIVVTFRVSVRRLPPPMKPMAMMRGEGELAFALVEVPFFCERANK